MGAASRLLTVGSGLSTLCSGDKDKVEHQTPDIGRSYCFFIFVGEHKKA